MGVRSVCHTQQLGDHVPGQPHGSSATSTTSFCGEAAPRRSPQNRSEGNWPLTYRKRGLDESLPIQASVSSPVQRG